MKNVCTTRTLCRDDSCDLCYRRSFASSPRASDWNYVLNNGVLPRHVFLNSHNKYWFTCSNCEHDFQALLFCINEGGWCPYCSHHKLCQMESCKLCLEKSFAFSSTNKVQYWNYKLNIGITPRDVFLNSNKNYWFTCSECGHDFQISTYHIHENKWCSYCANRLLCKKESCMSCFNKTFSAIDKAQYWNYVKNDGISPRDVFMNSNKKYWFICEKGHNFNITLAAISSSQNWCRYCVNKTEQKLQERLVIDFPSLQREITFQWSNKKRYDFMIPEMQIIIELDGPQHFRQISNWDSPENQFCNDMKKIMMACDNGYRVIRIVQEDVQNNSYDWYKVLYDTITRSKDMVSYISTNNEYELLSISINAIL